MLGGGPEQAPLHSRGAGRGQPDVPEVGIAEFRHLRFLGDQGVGRLAGVPGIARPAETVERLAEPEVVTEKRMHEDRASLEPTRPDRPRRDRHGRDEQHDRREPAALGVERETAGD
ncbi:MAG TPA: hypothetical protein VD788_03785, partial [Candidatus Polarisedimenticolaceae bacterium]|nr:hypothetical protein [Candidatus Polarisedimenticolaceae bacterium]